MATATEKENEVHLEDASSGDVAPTDGVQPVYDEMNLQAFLAIVVRTNPIDLPFVFLTLGQRRCPRSSSLTSTRC